MLLLYPTALVAEEYGCGRQSGGGDDSPETQIARCGRTPAGHDQVEIAMVRELAGGNNLTLPRLELLAPEIIFQFKLGQCLVSEPPRARDDLDWQQSVAASIKNLGSYRENDKVAPNRVGRITINVVQVRQRDGVDGSGNPWVRKACSYNLTGQHQAANNLKITASAD